jgi:hypothetical protein
MDTLAGTMAALATALYAAHHVGDYWIQTDHQSRLKGAPHGARACLAHVGTYTATQAAFVAATVAVTGAHVTLPAVGAGLAVSAVTHYLADRREHGIMLRLARLLPGRERFLALGVPRYPREFTIHDYAMVCQDGRSLPNTITITDNPCLGTGGWALDQSWHIFWGVFVASLVMVGLS